MVSPLLVSIFAADSEWNRSTLNLSTASPVYRLSPFIYVSH